jgi:hypothetical protein
MVHIGPKVGYGAKIGRNVRYPVALPPSGWHKFFPFPVDIHHVKAPTTLHLLNDADSLNSDLGRSF